MHKSIAPTLMWFVSLIDILSETNTDKSSSGWRATKGSVQRLSDTVKEDRAHQCINHSACSDDTIHAIETVVEGLYLASLVVG